MDRRDLPGGRQTLPWGLLQAQSNRSRPNSCSSATLSRGMHLEARLHSILIGFGILSGAEVPLTDIELAGTLEPKHELT